MTEAPGLPPEQDVVRRLLAEVRHDGSPPPEVVARLDDTLASLVAERGEPGSSATVAPVVDLGARRRRLAGVGLLAAAAVVVAGVAIGQGLPRMSGEDAGSTAGGDAATSQERELGNSDGNSDSGGQDSGSGAAEMGPQSLKSSAPVPEAGYPTLSSFDADLDDDLLDLRTSETGRAAAPGAGEALAGCDLRGIGRGRRVVAEVDGQPGVVVFRGPSGETQDVALYVCGTPEPVRTLTLPAP